MTDTSEQQASSHEPPWAGLIDRMAAEARSEKTPAARPQRRAHDLTEHLDATIARITPGAAFWYEQANAQRYDADTDPEPDDTESESADDSRVVERAGLDCRFCNPPPLVCDICGEHFPDELRRTVHNAVYADTKSHQRRKRLVGAARRRR